jgi:hypothetical protein
VRYTTSYNEMEQPRGQYIGETSKTACHPAERLLDLRRSHGFADHGKWGSDHVRRP